MSWPFIIIFLFVILLLKKSRFKPSRMSRRPRGWIIPSLRIQSSLLIRMTFLGKWSSLVSFVRQKLVLSTLMSLRKSLRKLITRLGSLRVVMRVGILLVSLQFREPRYAERCICRVLRCPRSRHKLRPLIYGVSVVVR